MISPFLMILSLHILMNVFRLLCLFVSSLNNLNEEKKEGTLVFIIVMCILFVIFVVLGGLGCYFKWKEKKEGETVTVLIKDENNDLPLIFDGKALLDNAK